VFETTPTKQNDFVVQLKKIVDYIMQGVNTVARVMLGVLLALYVNNWNQDLKNRAIEKDLVIQLHEEFLSNREQLNRVKKGHFAALNDAASLMKMFPLNPETVSLDTLNYFFFNADDGGAIMDRWTFNPSNAIVNAITNSSSFALITNEQLKLKLLTWKSVVDDYAEDERSMINYRNSVLVPYLIEHGIMTTKRFKQENLDYAFLASPKFESIVTERYRGISYIVVANATNNELVNLENAIDEIVKLTDITQYYKDE